MFFNGDFGDFRGDFGESCYPIYGDSVISGVISVISGNRLTAKCCALQCWVLHSHRI